MFSAQGCAFAGLSYTQQRTIRHLSINWDANYVAGVREALLQSILVTLGLSKADNRAHVEDVALIRYVGQSYSIEVPYTMPVVRDAIAHDFRRAHETMYGFSGDEPWEVEALRVRVSVPSRALVGDAWDGAVEPRPVESRPCWFSADAPILTRYLRRSGLKPGTPLPGPLIISDEWSTVVVPPGATLTPDASANLIIAVESR